MKKEKREKTGSNNLERKERRYFYLFIAPWLVGFFLLTIGPMPVSYTHLDVYKRQVRRTALDWPVRTRGEVLRILDLPLTWESVF